MPIRNLLDPNIRTGTADSILAALFRQILADYEIDVARLNDMIDKQALRLSGGVPDKRSQIRGNLRSVLFEDTLTWGNYTDGLKVLRVERAQLIFSLKHVKLISEHRLNIDLLNEPEEKPERNTLAVFFSHILHDLGIDVGRFDSLLLDYMRRARIPVTVATRTHVRGNLKKELLGGQLSWRSLVKAFDFLCVSELKIEEILEFRGGATSSHVRQVTLNDREDFFHYATSETDSIWL